MVWKVIVNMNVKQCFDAIEKLSKEEFHQKILRGVAATPEFSRLVCIGAKRVTEEQKKTFASSWKRQVSRQNMNHIRSLMRICRILAGISPDVWYRLDKDERDNIFKNNRVRKEIHYVGSY